MKKVVLILAFLAFSVNAVGQKRCADENGMPIECPTLIEINPEINPNGPDCKSCPTDLNPLRDRIYRDFIFRDFIFMPFKVVAKALHVVKER